MNQLNETTRRYPRTLNEAFGPYADQTPLLVKYDEAAFQREDMIVIIACTIASIFMAIIGYLGWL